MSCSFEKPVETVAIDIMVKANDLINVGKNLIRDSSFMEKKQAPYFREEFCTGSTLHRGYYHPSPVYDLVIGNTRRGRMTRQPATGKNTSERYLYDENGCLERVESFYNDRISYIEYILHSEKVQIGVTIDLDGRLAAISEEIFENNRIKGFSLVNCTQIGENYNIFNIHIENFYYDEVGLIECDFQNLSPGSGYLIDRRYRFERRDGFLTGYTDISAGLSTDRQKWYKIGKKRKA